MNREVTVALIGNPNAGKTTVFNSLTGAHQHVGNWPGKTVERKEGRCVHGGFALRVVDLPVVYSLTAYSPDEVVARDFIVEEKPDVVVDVVDASNLERNMYLVVQLLEMGSPLILALNMMDMVEARGHHIDVVSLSRLLGVRVVPMVASHSEGMHALLDEIVKGATERVQLNGFTLTYGREVDEEIARLEEMVSRTELARKYPSRWLAIKLLEQDEEVLKKFQAAPV